ncbi:ATP phosphoribosyltransferase regulatory subunit [Virgibacillus ainsalahensis]
MQNYIMSSDRDTIVEDFQIRDNLITTLKKRFSTYGFQQVRTSTFEYYDLYNSITGTVNKDEMLKVIDASGRVLVLRPDVTIPITRMVASNEDISPENLRLFYVLDAFRQSSDQADKKESTQAGVEYFGQNIPENNAEVAMLAIHTLKDLGFTNFKLEIGHAGFFKELIKQASITQQELEQLQALIQSKNLADINPFLTKLEIDNDLKSAIQSIPLLYGNPNDVIEQAEKIIRNENMKLLLQSLVEVYDVMKNYGVEDSIVFNLGLINNMNYYSGIIFQGFVEDFGKPVVMGGRYDHLGEQFGKPMPAIGFAFDIDDLLLARRQQNLSFQQNTQADAIIFYEKEKQEDAFNAGYQLRNKGYQVLTFRTGTMADDATLATNKIYYQNGQNLLISHDRREIFVQLDELVSLLQDRKGGN